MFVLKIVNNENLKQYNTFGINTIAEYSVRLEDESNVAETIEFAKSRSLKTLILGGGSNLLFTQKDFNGLVIAIRNSGIETIEEDSTSVLVKVKAGHDWDNFVEQTVLMGYSGHENLSLIPGLTGAAPIQNIGAYGQELQNICEMVEYFDTEKMKGKIILNRECSFGYRTSIFKESIKGKFIITAVYFRLQKGFVPKTAYGSISEKLSKMGVTKPTPVDLRNAVISIRKEKLPDPKVTGNAGSFFKNPVVKIEKLKILQETFTDIPYYPATEGYVKLSAGWLIEKCGFKGKREGNTGTAPGHALVICNFGEATGEEIISFAYKIKDSVFNKFTVEIEPEVNIIT
ncbi:MAG: UDP-N-acetylmuramate dehydrogenase [Ignavibacteriaceae bacterium]|nr:UDP-N-acetylmuramate dehydrogenase [Ignavibacteriaceae bacterium]